MTLGGWDALVLASYFALTVGVGLWWGRGERTTHDFFLGGRRQPWLLVGLSIVATEVSALTFLIVPGQSYESDFWYLQLYAGAFLGKVLIAVLLLPAFYGGSVTTVYEYLGQRFGGWTRTTASLMFFASRLVGSSVRLLAASLALAMMFDWPVPWVVFGAAGVATVYTTFGGIKSVIATDAVQAGVFLGGGIAVVILLFLATPGTWWENVAAAYHAGKFHTLRGGWQPNNDKLCWVLLVSGMFQTMAAMGTDQDLTQRMLTCPDLRRGQRSLMFNAIVGLPIVCLFLLIGALLFVFYHTPGGAPVPVGTEGEPDRIFAHFLSTAVPSGYGVKGLLVAGIFAASMSSLDSALGALSSTAVTDFYRPYLKRSASQAHYLRVARWLTVLFGVLIAGVALAFMHAGDLLEAALGWAGLIFGGMLGVFVLGVVTKRRGQDRMNVIAMLSSVMVLVIVKFLQESRGVVLLAWPWWVVVGTLWTFGVASLFSTGRLSVCGANQVDGA